MTGDEFGRFFRGTLGIVTALLTVLVCVPIALCGGCMMLFPLMEATDHARQELESRQALAEEELSSRTAVETVEQLPTVVPAVAETIIPEQRLPIQASDAPDEVAIYPSLDVVVESYDEPTLSYKERYDIAVEDAKWRTWTSADGTLKARAKFRSAANGKLKLEKPDGTIIVIDEKMLTEDDRQFVQQRMWVSIAETELR